MTALQLALTVKRLGACFEYRDGRLVVTNRERLPADIQQRLDQQVGDVLAVVSEHNPPIGVRVTDVVDFARRIVADSRKSSAHA